MRLTKHRLERLLLFVILALGIFFRFYQFPERISLGLDSSRDAFVALEGARQIQFPITGPFISITPATTGPWYWNQLIAAKLLLVTPYAPWLVTALYSVGMILVMYKIGALLGGKILGLIAALITALSPQQIANAVGLTNPSVIGFYSSLVVYLFLRLLLKGPNSVLGWCLGVILGLTINTHYQTIGLLTLPLSLLFYGKKYLKALLRVFAGLVITFIPLIIFELNNHWFTTRNIWQYIRVDQYNIWVPMRWLTYISDFWPNFISFALGGQKLLGLAVMVGIFLLFGYLTLRKKLNKAHIFLALSFLAQVVMIRYYRGERFFGYLQFFHPFLFLFTAWIFFYLAKTKQIVVRIFGIILLIGYGFLVLPFSYKMTTPETLTSVTLAQVESIRETIGPGPYTFYKCKDSTNDQIHALFLALTVKNLIAPNRKPIAYDWSCQTPNLLLNEKVTLTNSHPQKDEFFPKADLVRDFSVASEAAILEKNWIVLEAADIHHSATRWWMDEQP